MIATRFWQAPHTRYREWERIATYPDYLSAHIVAGLLENEGVPAVVEPAATFPDAMASRMWVPIELAHRARWILWLPAPSDAELTFLATGELDVDA